jgi:hypothetical protein
MNSGSRRRALILTDSQVAAREKAKAEKDGHSEFESECPGYCGAQDAFYVGPMKGVGRIYQQTFIDTDSKVVFTKLYDRETPLTAADLLNDRVLPFFDAHEVKQCRVLTDRGTESCGSPERHEYALYLAVGDVDHTRIRTKSPQTNSIAERFHKTVLDEFYRVTFRKKIYGSVAELGQERRDHRPFGVSQIGFVTQAVAAILPPGGRGPQCGSRSGFSTLLES